MAVSFSVPSSPKKSVFEIDQFLGVDLTNKGTNIDERRSPNAPNMIREVPGKVRKRMGYKTMMDFGDGIVYGSHSYNDFSSTGEVSDITNVNRVLNTQESAKTFSIDTEKILYEYADYMVDGRTLYYDFYYSSPEQIMVNFGSTHMILPAASASTHISGDITVNQKERNTNFINAISAKSVSGTTINIVISKMSVMYLKDSDYTWSAAPNEFAVENTFDVQNYSVSKSGSVETQYSTNATSTDDYGYTTISLANSKLIEYDVIHVSLNMTFKTNSEAEEGKPPIKLSLVYKNNYYEIPFYSGNNITDKQFDLYVPSTYGGNALYLIKMQYLRKANSHASYSYTYSRTLISNSIRSLFTDTRAKTLYHVGTKLYSAISDTEYSVVYDGMNTEYSTSFQFDDYLYLIDGKNYLRYAITENKIYDVVADGLGYIPTVTIAKAPMAGGQSYEDLNLIQPGFIETFECDDDVYVNSESARTFQLSFDDLDETTVKVFLLNSYGNWTEKKEGTHFQVNRPLGRIQMNTAPGKTPITGTPNVKIQAYKTFNGYADKIKKCCIATLFGVGGATDRMFVSGNPDFPNQDWHSQYNDPTYFADTSYSALGTSKSAIVGYSIINNYLATHKDNNEPSQSVFIREGDLVESEAVFKLVNTLQGTGAIARRSFNYLETEPLFLTDKGIFAITAQDITGEKYGQNRSYYLNGSLLDEGNLSDAHSVIYNDFYILALNNKLYVLDGLQAMRTDKSEPYATRQYAGFYCTNIPASTMWVDKGALWFGTKDGKLCKFYNDKDSLESYSDDGAIIKAWWETPDLDGKLFFKNKTFRYVAIRLMTALSTSVTIYGMKRGIWSLIKKDNSSARYFSYENITFSKFTWSIDQGEKVSHSKTRIKKVDKARFKLENNELNEPFGVFNFAVEYVESGNYKG